MHFDDLLDEKEEKVAIDYLKPSRKNLDPLLDQNIKQTLISIIIYSIQIMLAYLFLVQYMKLEDQLTIYIFGSFFVGIGAFVDQLLNPDENSKTGYFILLALYYVIYKVVVFGYALFLILPLFDLHYELHLREYLPGMTIFVFWAVGQKVGYYFQHKNLIRKANAGIILSDIDKLKIFLYQVHRRSFLKMIIQRNQAKFEDTSEFIKLAGKISNKEFQEITRLRYLSMSKFLKYLKLTDLPENKYITFEQILEIDFSKNKIKKFSTYLFEIFPMAETIDLSNNKIKKFSQDDQIALLEHTGNVVINFDGNPIFS